MVEIVGLIISGLALLYLFIKQSAPVQQKRTASDHRDEEVSGDSLQQFFKMINNESMKKEGELKRPPSPPSDKKKKLKKKHHTPLEDNRLPSSIEERRLKSALEERHIQSKLNPREHLAGHRLAVPQLLRDERTGKRSSSRLRLAVRRLGKRSDLVIYQEIIGKPKSLRSENF